MNERIAFAILSHCEAAASESQGECDDIEEFDRYLLDLLQQFPQAKRNLSLWWIRPERCPKKSGEEQNVKIDS